MAATEPILVYSEEKYGKTEQNKKAIFIYEWLRNLEDNLSSASKAHLKSCQPKLVEQLTKQLNESCGPATRQLLAKCFALLYSVGSTNTLFQTVDKCTDIIKSKDDSQAYLPVKLAAAACIGAIFEKVGRMVGNTAQDTVQILIKSMKNAESQGKCEVMLCLQRMMKGLGNYASSSHKDIFKAVKAAITDRSMPVRCAATKCALELINNAPFMYTSELESMMSACFRALDGSNYDVRVCVAQLLGTLTAMTQDPKAGSGKGKKISLEEVLSLMSGGFLRGGIGFLKGSGGELLKSSASREVRVGVTQAYVVLFTEMGSLWVERNVSLILTHVLELLSSSKATQTHVDAVYSRRCVSFVLRALLGRLLDESAQIEAAKELCNIITKQMNLVNDAIHANAESNGSSASGLPSMDVISTQHVLVCALQELGSLIKGLSTSSISLVSENILDHVLSVLLHPAPAAQLAATWCLRCVTTALPSQLSPMIDRCADKIKLLHGSAEAVGGYAHAFAALVGGVHQCPLGIPNWKGKLMYSIGEDLLRTATQSPKTSLQKTKAGWVLLGALMTLGPSVVKHHVQQLMTLWASAFPRSSKEFEQEKNKGDSFTWHVTLESRAGALCSIASFLACCHTLVTEDVVRRLLTTLDVCLAMLASMPQIIKQHGNHLKASSAMVRLRMYSVFSHLPPRTYEGSFHGLLRELVAEFTLAENPAMTTTSLLRTVCHKDDSILLGSWLQETDHKAVEDQLQPNSASGSGALEHDPSCVFMRCPEGEDIPGPLPLGVAVIDSSIKLFGLVFPVVALKHRNQLLVHFCECIKHAKSSRQQAIQTNILTAFLCALKCLAETKTTLGDEEVRNTAQNLVMGAMANPDPIVRCAAGEAIGRITQVVGNPVFTANIAQKIFDQLKSARDGVTRTGLSLALGCLHRYVGGMGSGKHLNNSVSILLALSQDSSSSIVQVWALHALALIADCGGPMFRGYIEPTFAQVINLVLTIPPALTEVHQCLGKCLAALITSVGPELQGTSKIMKDLRSSCLVACAIMQNHPDSVVQAEAINCLEQLHVFAPNFVNMATLVRRMCSNLSSPHLLLRRATVACLRQLSQREAKEVCEHALAAAEEIKPISKTYGVVIGDKGLEGALFGMLDTEVDVRMRSDIHDTLISMLSTLAPDNLTHWLGLCRDVLASKKGGKQKKGQEAQQTAEKSGDDKSDDEGDDGDEGGGMTINEGPEDTHPKVAPRWPTRMFATECIRKIIAVCENNRAHFDLALARELREESSEDFLVMHLQELVRMAFIAATATCDQLKLEGLRLLQDIVQMFASVPDPDFPGHVLLEQFQAQVGAALRPAFAPDMPSDVTAMACEELIEPASLIAIVVVTDMKLEIFQVCSAWIGSGIARDLNDVRRIQQLLVTSLWKFSADRDSSCEMFNEAATTMEKLAVLMAWAEVYIVAMKEKNAPAPVSSPHEENLAEPPGSLLALVEPELKSLSKYWLGALRDHALLSLPAQYHNQLPADGGMFYSPDSMEQCRPHYRKCWPPIIHAAALWLNSEGFDTAKNEVQVNAVEKPGGSKIVTPGKTPAEINKDRFHLLVGICMESLCSPRATQSNATVSACLHAFYCLLDSPRPRNYIGQEQILAVEMLNVLHRLMLTRDSHEIRLSVMDVTGQIVKAAQEALNDDSFSNFKGVEDAGTKEKGESDLTPGNSLVYGVMEICMCVLTRQLPGLVPSSNQPPGVLPKVSGTASKGLSEETCKLVCAAVSTLALVPGLCQPEKSVVVLPSVLFLVTGVLREVSRASTQASTLVSASLHALKQLVMSPFTKNSRCAKDWIDLLQSALATLLEGSNPEDSSSFGMDDSVTILAIALFILSGPREVSLVEDLHNRCITVFVRCLISTDCQLQLKALQTASSVFHCSDRHVAVPFIHALAPHVVMLLNNACVNKPTSETQLPVIMESIKILESLVELAEDDRRVHMLGVLIPILVALLGHNSATTKHCKVTKTLHDHCLQRLMKVGPQYPQPFKAIMSTAPELKQQLETAVRANQASAKAKSPSAQPKAAPAQPSIKLRMDFSNYK